MLFRSAGTLNDTPGSNRLHIGVFGKTNSGKSSFINAFTHQEVSIVADVAGTTTDPVYKPMEISPLGPCVIIDTAGFDDETELGERRVEKTKLAAEKADIAVIVVSGADACREDASETKDAKEKLQQSSEKNQENLPDLTEELKWYQFLKEKNTPVLFLVGKADIDPHTDELASYIKEKTGKQALTVSAKTGAGSPNHGSQGGSRPQEHSRAAQPAGQTYHGGNLMNTGFSVSEIFKSLLGEAGKLDTDSLLILLMLFTLYKNKADIKLLVALGYILL